mmetsp:Transcript_7444/g.24737  ORF Transcript_7444/g.24737 Transcript_7444/m.24737 type:complete len:141 (-) Transcript_7444:800-1222(-)
MSTTIRAVNAQRATQLRSTRRAVPKRFVVHAATKKEAETETEEAAISGSGLRQLIKMGLGAVSGDITEINLNDPQRTVVMELEANQFEDKDGKPLALTEGALGKGDWTEEGGSTPLANILIPLVLGGVSVALVVFTLQAL